jgi:hypothetical protein
VSPFLSVPFSVPIDPFEMISCIWIPLRPPNAVSMSTSLAVCVGPRQRREASILSCNLSAEKIHTDHARSIAWALTRNDAGKRSIWAIPVKHSRDVKIQRARASRGSALRRFERYRLCMAFKLRKGDGRRSHCLVGSHCLDQFQLLTPRRRRTVRWEQNVPWDELVRADLERKVRLNSTLSRGFGAAVCA